MPVYWYFCVINFEIEFLHDARQKNTYLLNHGLSSRLLFFLGFWLRLAETTVATDVTFSAEATVAAAEKPVTSVVAVTGEFVVETAFVAVLIAAYGESSPPNPRQNQRRHKIPRTLARETMSHPFADMSLRNCPLRSESNGVGRRSWHQQTRPGMFNFEWVYLHLLQKCSML